MPYILAKALRVTNGRARFSPRLGSLTFSPPLPHHLAATHLQNLLPCPLSSCPLSIHFFLKSTLPRCNRHEAKCANFKHLVWRVLSNLYTHMWYVKLLQSRYRTFLMPPQISFVFICSQLSATSSHRSAFCHYRLIFICTQMSYK